MKERKQLSTKPNTRYRTLIDLLRWRAVHQPDKLAYTLMTDGTVETSCLTYAELDRQARAIGRWLQQAGARGERVLLLYPQGLEVIAAFFGCLYAGAIAVPVPVPKANRLKWTLPRLQAIANDADACLVFTTTGIKFWLEKSCSQIPEFPAMNWLATETIDLALAQDWQKPKITGDWLAYLQYKADSSSTPTGVAIAHQNILFQCNYLQTACGYDADSVTVTWMPHFHEYGLIEGLLEPIYNGTPCYLMSLLTFVRRPFSWLETITRYRATHSQANNFAYDRCLRSITPEQLTQLDLSNWRTAGSSIKSINPKILAKFLETFAPCGFRAEALCPAYGLPEASIHVSFTSFLEAPTVLTLDLEAFKQNRIVPASPLQKKIKQLLGCGHLLGNMEVIIVNPKTRTRCNRAQVGEIWLSDPCLARGYWQKEAETKAIFQAYLQDTGEGPFLRTGDLGFMYNGQLFFSGRIQHEVSKVGTPHYFSAVVNSTESDRGDRPGGNKSGQDSKEKTDTLLQWLREYADVRSNSRRHDEQGFIPPYIVSDLAERGLLGLQIPEEQNGLALNHSDTMRIMEQLGALDRSIALLTLEHNCLGTRPISNYGQSSLQKKLLPMLAKGQKLAAFAISEPGAESNLHCITTTAIPEGNGVWRLEGTKYGSSLSARTNVINVFAQTLDEQGQPQGISGFTLSQDTPRLRQGSEVITSGRGSIIHNTIYFEDFRVTENQLLGEVGKGVAIAQDAMMYSRFSVGAISLGGMKRCAQLMLRYASYHSTSAGSLLNSPVTLAKLGELNAQIASIEALITRISNLLDRSHILPPEPFLVSKIAGAEFFWQATDSLIQLLGERNELKINIVSQLWRDARVLRIFAGSTETLNMYLGSRILNHSEEIHQFLSQELKAPEVSNNLQAVTAQIKKRHLGYHSPVSNGTRSRNWAAALAGEIATYAILLAVLKEAFSFSGSELLSRAIEWAQLNFEQKCKAALWGSPKEAILADGKFNGSIIANYAQTVGELKPLLLEEEQVSTRFLRIEQKENNLTSLNSASLRKIAAPVDSDSVHTFESIHNWIINLLQQKWKIPVSSIDPGKTFTDYGLDSVMAVTLAQELEDWLGFSLEATIFWNFPTIESLAHYLVRKLNELTITSLTDENSVESDLITLTKS